MMNNINMNIQITPLQDQLETKFIYYKDEFYCDKFKEVIENFDTKDINEVEKREESPRQQVFQGENGLRDSFGRNYDLFNSNEIYFFGTKNDDKKIYIITQC
jgi:hypothetical protein